ncbi:MAG: ABC transporter permease, partial [SAR324 cluster bacterium]|nr:ABC transporter permease [SAR324 cluster bacterium]
MSNHPPAEDLVLPDRPLFEIWRMFFANKAAVLGLALWILIISMAFLGPVIYPSDPFEMVGAPMSPPGEELLLGT